MKGPFPYPAIFLIFAELVFIVGSTWWPSGINEPFLFSMVNAALFSIGGYLLSHHKRWLATYLPLTLIALGVELMEETALTILLREISLSLIFVMLFSAVIHHSWFWPKTTRTDRLLAGIGGYLLLGIFWTVQFEVLTALGTAPLQNTLTDSQPGPQEILYYAFITLTAVGYGEIVPVTPLARTLAIIASLGGTLYLAVFISSLVSAQKGQS